MCCLVISYSSRDVACRRVDISSIHTLGHSVVPKKPIGTLLKVWRALVAPVVLVTVHMGVIGIVHTTNPLVAVRGVHITLPVADLEALVPHSARPTQLQNTLFIDTLPVLVAVTVGEGRPIWHTSTIGAQAGVIGRGGAWVNGGGGGGGSGGGGGGAMFDLLQPCGVVEPPGGRGSRDKEEER